MKVLFMGQFLLRMTCRTCSWSLVYCVIFIAPAWILVMFMFAVHHNIYSYVFSHRVTACKLEILESEQLFSVGHCVFATFLIWK